MRTFYITLTRKNENSDETEEFFEQDINDNMAYTYLTEQAARRVEDSVQVLKITVEDLK